MARLLTASCQLGQLIFRTEEGVLCANTDERILTPKEDGILKVLCENPEKTLTQEILFRKVWNETSALGCRGKVDNQIGSLRKKSEELGESALIQTVRGRGYRLGVTLVAVPADHATRSSPSSGYFPATDLMRRFTLAGGLERGSRVVIESPHPLELLAEFSDLVWTNIHGGGVWYFFLLDITDSQIAAKLVGMVLDSACRNTTDASGEPLSSAESIMSDDRVLNALQHLRIVFAPRVSSLSIYVRNAHNRHTAELFEYDIHERRAIRLAEREIAHGHAMQLLEVLPDEQQIVQLGIGMQRQTSSLERFEADLIAESVGSSWELVSAEVLRFVLRPRKPPGRCASRRRRDAEPLRGQKVP